jgi:hypothetical protein
MPKSFLAWIMAVIGVGVSYVTIMFAMGLGGGGHGWVTPFFLAPSTAIFFPIAYFRLGSWRETNTLGNVIMLILAAITVIALVIMTLNEGLRYFLAAEGAGWLWVAIWSSWIVAAMLTALLRQRNPNVR